MKCQFMNMPTDFIYVCIYKNVGRKKQYSIIEIWKKFIATYTVKLKGLLICGVKCTLYI